MVKNETNNKRRVQQLREGGAEDLKDFYTHYRDTCYGSGSVSLTWAREASELILTLLEEREALKERAQYSESPRVVLRLMKDGHIWDYTKHVEDVTAWSRKILAYEPDARIEVEYASEEEMYAWKEGF